MKGDVFAGMLGLVVGSAVVAGGAALRIGTPLDPEPGFFPLLGGVGLIASSSALLVQSRLARSSGGAAFGEMRRPAILVVALGVYVAILEPVGYVAATVLIAAVILRVLGVTSWVGLVAGSIALPVVTWLLFARLLGVELPTGQFGPFG
jgi:putative tricarboxylic transport membrane protein